MSHIITKLKCEHCGQEINDIYISLGHPEKDFVWRWKCGKCMQINSRYVKSWPIGTPYPKDETDA